LRRFTLLFAASLCAAILITPTAIAAGTPKAHAAAYKAKGTTSQGGAVVLYMSKSGRTLELDVEYTVSCDSGATYSDAVAVTGIPGHLIYKTGHHISRVKFRYQANGTRTLNGGLTGNLDMIVAGNVRLDTANVRGTIQPTMLVNGDKCTSGLAPITYSAKF
jgi:hypothetical protein